MIRTRRNFWLCLPLAVTGLGDECLTLIGNNITGLSWGWEISPIWRWFLQRGVVPYGFAFTLYLVIVGTIVAYAPRRLSKILCITMVLAHTYGIVSWLYVAGFSYYLWPLVFVTIAVTTVIGLEKSYVGDH